MNGTRAREYTGKFQKSVVERFVRDGNGYTRTGHEKTHVEKSRNVLII